jgi:hypothetical protein
MERLQDLPSWDLWLILDSAGKGEAIGGAYEGIRETGVKRAVKKKRKEREQR